MADRVSPIAPFIEPGRHGRPDGAPGVALSERLCPALVQVQAWPDTIDAATATLGDALGLSVRDGTDSSRDDRHSVLPTGPGRWLIDSEQESLEDDLRAAIGTETGAVTGLTHARVVVEISGPKVEWVLASGIALDFSQSAFPVSTVALGHHHEIGLVIHRTASDAFDLYVFTSFARSFWGWITRASEEVGYTVS